MRGGTSSSWVVWEPRVLPSMGCALRSRRGRAVLAQNAVTEVFEGRYEAAMKAEDWLLARGVISELEDAVPEGSRAYEMQMELARLQAAQQKRLAIADGLAAFDNFLKEGDVDQASVALRVIRQMAGKDPAVLDAAKRLAVVTG